jgi:hypothetical protein
MGLYTDNVVEPVFHRHCDRTSTVTLLSRLLCFIICFSSCNWPTDCRSQINFKTSSLCNYRFFPNLLRVFIYHTIIWHYIIWLTKASLNKKRGTQTASHSRRRTWKIYILWYIRPVLGNGRQTSNLISSMGLSTTRDANSCVVTW